MEYTAQQDIMKKPSEDSVQEMLALIHQQQTVPNVGEDTSVGFRGRVFNPLPPIETKVNSDYGTQLGHVNNTGDFGENKRKHTVEDEFTRPQQLERESTFFELRQSRSTDVDVKNTARTSLDFKSRRVENPPATHKSTKAITTPRHFPLRREGTNYHLPPLPEPQFQDPPDIERPSAPSPTSRDKYLDQSQSEWREESVPGCDVLFSDEYEPQSENVNSNGGREAQLSPWSADQETKNTNDEFEWQESREIYERPRTARGRRRNQQPEERPRTPNGRYSSTDTTITDRPKSGKGRRRMRTEEPSEPRPTTARGSRRREAVEQEAYEPYERPRTARGRRHHAPPSADSDTMERPTTARGRRRSTTDERAAEKQRPSKGRTRPKSPGPHHPRYAMMNTKTLQSSRDVDDGVAVMMNSAR